MELNEALPAEVLDLLRAGSVTQFATLSAAGVPIDTPVLFFPSDGPRSLDIATGLSYPAKAERARRNPRVGLLIEGGAGEPVVSIAGHAAVRDGDLQANALRYLAEAGHTLPFDPPWALARQAVWYWTRILIEIVPARVLWWADGAATDAPPDRWDAPVGTAFPVSDPAPPGAVSKPATWTGRSWRDLAVQALERGAPGHLSVVAGNGFPLPAPTRAIRSTENGFAIESPAGLPWRLDGPASLTFGGLETFIGEVAPINGGASMTVERALPVLPMTEDQTQLWEPAPETRAQLMRRLTQETERRGQPIPTIPEERPAPTDGYRRRMARMAAQAAQQA